MRFPLVAAFLLPAPLGAQAVPSFERVAGEVAFDARATLGDFTGHSTALSGALVGAADLAYVTGWVEVPAATLVTGNGRRDRDMYKVLDVEQHPRIRFDLEAVGPGAADGDSIRVTLRGRFRIHGVTQVRAVPGWVWLTADAVRFKGALPMDVREYEIEGLSKMLGILRMHEDIVVRMDVTFGR